MWWYWCEPSGILGCGWFLGLARIHFPLFHLIRLVSVWVEYKAIHEYVACNRNYVLVGFYAAEMHGESDQKHGDLASSSVSSAHDPHQLAARWCPTTEKGRHIMPSINPWQKWKKEETPHHPHPWLCTVAPWVLDSFFGKFCMYAFAYTTLVLPCCLSVAAEMMLRDPELPEVEGRPELGRRKLWEDPPALGVILTGEWTVNSTEVLYSDRENSGHAKYPKHPHKRRADWCWWEWHIK